MSWALITTSIHPIQNLGQDSPSHSLSYSQLTANPQDQHVTPEVAMGASTCSEWHPLLMGSVNLDQTARKGKGYPSWSSINLAPETARISVHPGFLDRVS